MLIIFSPLFLSSSVMLPYSIYPLDIVARAPITWRMLKITYVLFHALASLAIANALYMRFLKRFEKVEHRDSSDLLESSPGNLHLLIGRSFETNSCIYIPEKSLYQNILVTGTIGSGKTSSAMYPFIKQLIAHNNPRIGMLVLDVKGNFYEQVKLYASEADRENDLIIVELGRPY